MALPSHPTASAFLWEYRYDITSMIFYFKEVHLPHLLSIYKYSKGAHKKGTDHSSTHSAKPHYLYYNPENSLVDWQLLHLWHCQETAIDPLSAHNVNTSPILKTFFFSILAALGLRCSRRTSLTWVMWDFSSPTRDRTRVPCIGRRIVNHWTTGEVPHLWVFLFFFFFFLVLEAPYSSLKNFTLPH